MAVHLRRVMTLVPAVLLIVGWFALFGPTVLGGPATYVAVSGTSMQPTLVEGDLAVVRRADTYRPGDIVVFRVPSGEPAAGGLVIHRIIGGSAAGFIVQGDNKAAPDPWRPSATDIAGTLWLRLPGAAVALTWLRNPALFAAVAAGLTAFVVMAGGRAPVRHEEPVIADGRRGISADPYRWTPDRGLAVCGGPSTRVEMTSLLPARTLSPAEADAVPFRWTVARGRAVCGIGGATAATGLAVAEG